MERISAVVLLTLYCYWLKRCYTKSQTIEARWSRFDTNVIYTNIKLITELEDIFSPLYFSSEMPLLYSKMECARSCAYNDSCHAFNFYPAGLSYVCELVPTNLCRNNTRRAFVQWPGNQVWEKLPADIGHTCLATLYPSVTNIPCDVMRPGCLGYWPNCLDCTKVCTDCFYRNNRPDFHNCTLWPGGDKDWPIFGTCYRTNTYLIKQLVNLTTGSKQGSYRMSFYDMNRVCRLKVYAKLEFHFITSSDHHAASYNKFYVDEKGTLSNLSGNAFDQNYDMFKLQGITQAKIPFVNVTDDRYSCGSFWLLDPNNATYCPGGKVRMFGKVQMNGSKVTSTGLSYPTLPSSSAVVYASMELV